MTADVAQPEALAFALGSNDGATPDQIADLVDPASDVDRIVIVMVAVPRGREEGTNAAIAEAGARYGSASIADRNTLAASDPPLLRSDGYQPPTAMAPGHGPDLVLATVG